MSFMENWKSWKIKSFESPQRRKWQKWLSGEIYRQIIITHTAQTHSEPNQTSGMEPFANMAEYFCSKVDLRSRLYGGQFQLGLKYEVVEPWWWDFILHAKRHARFEQTELKFSLHVSELKVIMQSIIKARLNWKE